MKFNIREKIFVIGLILSLIIFLMINAVSYWNTRQHIEGKEKVEKTLIIIHEFENLISMIKDAETGQRGFIITGDWTFLEPYYNGVTAVHQSMRRLKELTPRDNKTCQQIDTIEVMIEKRFAQFHKTINLRREKGIEAVIKSIMTAEDEKIMQDILYLVEESKQEKTDLLNELNRISKKNSQRTLFTIIIGNLIALLFVLLSLFQLYRDITERKLAELALQESEEKYRAVVERANHCIAIVVDGIIRFSNSAFNSIFGYEKSEIDGMKLTMFSPPECLDEVVDRYRRRMAGEKLSPLWETTLLHKNGTRVLVESSGGYIRFEGKPADLIFIRDITERKRMEEALKESENKFRSFAENALVGIYLVQDEVLKYVNPKFADIFGHTVEECLNNMHIRQILHPEDFEPVQKNIHKRASGEIESVHYTIRGIKKTGEIIYCEIYGSSIMFRGTLTATGTILEITDRKLAEAQLKDSRQLLRSLVGRLEKVREEEMVIISREIHDVMGGGLTGLQMDLFWLMHKIENAGSGKEQAALISRILSSSEAVDRMIKVTRRISTELRPPVLDDLGMIAAMEWQLSEFTRHSGIPHRFTTAFEYIPMDSDHAIALFRIFQETLTNIMRHSGATEVVVILRGEGSNPSGDENLILEIMDDGRGITEEEILNSKSLGLVGMKERALTFEGEFSISGEPGAGTTVLIRIPGKKRGNNDKSYYS